MSSGMGHSFATIKATDVCWLKATPCLCLLTMKNMHQTHEARLNPFIIRGFKLVGFVTWSNTFPWSSSMLSTKCTALTLFVFGDGGHVTLCNGNDVIEPHQNLNFDPTRPISLCIAIVINVIFNTVVIEALTLKWCQATKCFIQSQHFAASSIWGFVVLNVTPGGHPACCQRPQK